jgi:predicted RNA-binding protein with TRAM domain
MRVLCIDSKVRPNSCNHNLLHLINEGEEYEVYDTRLGKGTDGIIGIVYYLVGINERPNGFNANRFIPISDIDETELVNEREEVYG